MQLWQHIQRSVRQKICFWKPWKIFSSSLFFNRVIVSLIFLFLTHPLHFFSEWQWHMNLSKKWRLTIKCHQIVTFIFPAICSVYLQQSMSQWIICVGLKTLCASSLVNACCITAHECAHTHAHSHICTRTPATLLCRVEHGDKEKRGTILSFSFWAIHLLVLRCHYFFFTSDL